MDDERKLLLTVGIYHGDIALALAALAAELPPYVQGLDVAQLAPEDNDFKGITQQVDAWSREDPAPERLAPPILRLVVERAIARDKFLSAIRCLEMLDEKEKYVDKYVSEAAKLIDQAKMEEAARALVVASNLDIEEGTPLFQYLGAGLHEGCTTAPEKCVTRFASDEAVLRSLKYLLSSERVFDVVAELPAETRRALLPRIALERDPDAIRFYADFKKAHNEIKETEEGLIGRLVSDLEHVAGEVAGFPGSLERISPKSETKDTLERLKRTAVGMRKEFADVKALVDEWQFRRLADRVAQLLDARSELEDTHRGAGGADPSISAAIDGMLALIDDLRKKGIPEQIDSAEQRLVSAQTSMLGRQVSSQEHWQFLREIAFKYPVSPLMVCLRRINDRWMVVPQWDSEIVAAFREHFETQPVPPVEPTSTPDP
jgi:hypothetical protein